MTAAVWLIIFAMVGCNALFAAYEIALASASLGRLKALADAHRAGARVALSMKQNMEGSLAALQLGITLVGAIAAATGGADADELIVPYLERSFGFSPRSAHVLSLAILVIPLSAV